MKLNVWLVSIAEARQRLTEKIRKEIESDFKWEDMPGISPSYDTDTDYGDLPGSDASTIFVYEDLPDMMYMDPSQGLFDDEIKVPSSGADKFESLDDASRSPRQLQEKFIRPEWRDYQNSQPYVGNYDESISSDNYLNYEDYSDNTASYDYKNEYEINIHNPLRRILKVPPIESVEAVQMAAHKTETIMEFVTRTPGEDRILKMKLPVQFNNEHHTLSWQFSAFSSEFEGLDPQLVENDYYQGNQMVNGEVVDTFLIAFASAPDGAYTLTLFTDDVPTVEKIFNVRTIEPETFVCDCEKKLDKEDEEPVGPSDFDLLHDSTSSVLPFTSYFEESAKAVLSKHMAENSFAPISEDEAEVLAKVIREKAISINGENIECVVSDEEIVSNRFVFSASTDFLYAACFEVCNLSEPYKELNIGNSMNFSLCSLREKSERCFLKILSQMDACDRFYQTGCACDEDQTITILSGRTVGTTLAVHFVNEAVGKYSLLTFCNKC
ncbi:unnamed protein product [Oikopleura dioica]|uniref:Uncharacterized protein n=1 Tax=Oikopleura dioica TaxID=34765 RepID=E4X3L0_OIKDI|nr:unnamed protein product [Oikopleura dioica]